MSEVDEAAFGASESSSLLPGHPEVVGGTGYVEDATGSFERSLFHYSNVVLLVSSFVGRLQITLPYVAYRQFMRLSLKISPSVQGAILTIAVFAPTLALAPMKLLLNNAVDSRRNGLWLAAGAALLGGSWLAMGAQATSTGGVLLFCILLALGQLGSQLMLAATHVLVTERVSDESSVSSASALWVSIAQAR